MREVRPYQHEFIQAAFDGLFEFNRVLGVAPTGSGKTVMAGQIVRRAGCPVLFLADAKTLVRQAADKLGAVTGKIADVEMGTEHASPYSQLIVATTQSMANRLDKYPPDAFGLIVVDEAHRNTLGAQAQSVFKYFSRSQVLGMTATPYRSDKKELGSFYEKITDCDIGLVRLINEGWLSKIVIKSVPSGIEITDVKCRGGDFIDSELGAAIEPHIDKLAKILAQYAPNRRTVAFLPLRETSRKFVEACKRYGLRAIHVDGEDRAGIDHFKNGEPGVIANAQLLSTGWDEPCVDCVYSCRPSKSFSLLSQQIGRGTRIHPGKENLLVLDPLFLGFDLVRPSRLIARTEEEAKAMDEAISDQGELDLLEAQKIADDKRAEGLRKRMAETKHRKAKTIDALEFALAINEDSFVDYQPETDREARPATSRQLIAIENAGFDPEVITCFGHASKMLDMLGKRRELGLATPKQCRMLRRYKHPTPYQCSFSAASLFIDKVMNR